MGYNTHMQLPVIYKALGDESRLRIVHVLSHGAFNVQELTAMLHLSQPTVSHHLRILAAAGVVGMRKEGTWAFYSLKNGEGDAAAGRVVKNMLEVLTDEGAGSAAAEYRKDTKSAEAILFRRRDAAHRFFESVAPEWKKIREEAQGQESYLENLIAEIPSSGTLLELGCGSGSLLERVLPRKGVTIGVDYSQAMLDEARRVIQKHTEGVELRLGYLEHLPVADESVDAAVAYMVFHHLVKPQEALQDTARVLRRSGRLVIIDLVKHDNELMRERFADLWLGFEKKEFLRWLDHSGFSNVNFSLLGDKREAFLVTAIKG